MLLLFVRPQQPVSPSSPEYIDLNGAVSDILPLLNASGSSDLVWWTVDELFQWFDEAARRIAREAGVFVARDTTVTTVQGQGTYNLPANQIATIQVDLGGFVLRPANVQEIEALDADWISAVGSPLRFLQDVPMGEVDLTLHPAPDANAAGVPIGLVMHVWPPTDDAYHPLIPAPTVLREYFTFSALAGARSKETKAAMPEVAQWFGQLVGLYEQTIANYWGAAM